MLHRMDFKGFLLILSCFVLCHVSIHGARSFDEGSEFENILEGRSRPMISGMGRRVLGDLKATKAVKRPPKKHEKTEKLWNKNKDILRGLNIFAFDFHKTLPKDGNLFYSPYSIAATLAMVYAGSKGKTREEIADAFGWSKSAEYSIHKTLGGLLFHLTSSDGKGSMKVANKIWIAKGDLLWRNFTKLSEKYYASKVGKVNFFTNPEGSRKAINSWVMEKTGGKIKNLVPQGAIDSATRLVLTNAVHFKAAWETAFDAKNTKLEPFTTASNKKLKIKMMTGAFDVTLKRNGDFVGIELPYKGKRFSMQILMPQEGSLAEAEERLTLEVLESLKSVDTRMKVTLPRFKMIDNVKLVRNLKSLKIRKMFSSECDLSGMLRPTEPIFVTDAIHKAFIQVNEKGTEASAATAMFLGRSFMPEFRADRPFLFFIKDTFSNVILFAGRFSPS